MSRWLRPQPNEALAEMMARDAEAEGEGQPFGGWACEFVRPDPEPPPPTPAPLVFPPPPWSENFTGEVATAPVAPRGAAVGGKGASTFDERFVLLAQPPARSPRPPCGLAEAVRQV